MGVSRGDGMGVGACGVCHRVVSFPKRQWAARPRPSGQARGLTRFLSGRDQGAAAEASYVVVHRVNSVYLFVNHRIPIFVRIFRFSHPDFVGGGNPFRGLQFSAGAWRRALTLREMTALDGHKHYGIASVQPQGRHARLVIHGKRVDRITRAKGTEASCDRGRFFVEATRRSVV